MRRHSHLGKYRSRTPRGRVTYKRRPQHNHTVRVEKKGRIITTRPPKEVLDLAKKVEKKLKPYSQKIQLAGSVRRKKIENINDIDIVLIPKNKEKIKELLRREGEKIQEGNEKVGYNIKNVKTEIYFAQPKTWESMLMYATGPVGANIKNREIARDKGFLLDQRGLFKRLPGNKPGRLIANTERSIYKALGKTYRPPELRGLPR